MLKCKVCGKEEDLSTPLIDGVCPECCQQGKFPEVASPPKDTKPLNRKALVRNAGIVVACLVIVASGVLFANKYVAHNKLRDAASGGYFPAEMRRAQDVHVYRRYRTVAIAALVGSAISLVVLLLGRKRWPAVAVGAIAAAGAGCFLAVGSTRAMENEKEVNCTLNISALGKEVYAYARNSGSYAFAKRWSDALESLEFGVERETFHCPNCDSEESSYAINANLLGKTFDDVSSSEWPARTVLLFEIDGGWNVVAGPEALPERPRHPNGYVFYFADGHTENVSTVGIDSLVWEIKKPRGEH